MHQPASQDERVFEFADENPWWLIGYLALAMVFTAMILMWANAQREQIGEINRALVYVAGGALTFTWFSLYMGYYHRPWRAPGRIRLSETHIVYEEDGRNRRVRLALHQITRAEIYVVSGRNGALKRARLIVAGPGGTFTIHEDQIYGLSSLEGLRAHLLDHVADPGRVAMPYRSRALFWFSFLGLIAVAIVLQYCARLPIPNNGRGLLGPYMAPRTQLPLD